MDFNTLETELKLVQAESVNKYLNRQALQITKLQLEDTIQLVEMEMIKLDGKEEILKKLIALESQKSEKKDGE